MTTEIERKYLVTGEGWRDEAAGIRMAQGYLCMDPDRTVRVRLAGDSAWLTLKGRSQGITRAEFEYPIPPDDARELLALCLPSVIEKTRHRVEWGGRLWEVDVFHGANEGLIVAEVELADESVNPERPPWVGEEVSADPRFYNSALAVAPFQDWPK
jgi:adenylate cyclase